MFTTWGHWVYRFRWATLFFSGLFLIASILIVLRGGSLSTGSVEGTEADRGLQVIERELGQPASSRFSMLFFHPTRTVDDPSFRESVLATVAPLRADPRVALVQTPYDTTGPFAQTLRSQEAHRALILVSLREEFRAASRTYAEVRKKLVSHDLELTCTGPLPFKHDLDRTLEADLQHAEMITLPLTLLVLFLAFGSVVAATIPVGVGSLAVVGGVAAVLLLSRAIDVAQYAINIVTLIGLGVAIDYSLFIVDRFRTCLKQGLSIEDAIVKTLSTAGRAVAFSGLAVTVGLSGLLFYRGSYLSSMGIAGALVVALSVLYSLTFLPALLSILGPRINKGQLRFLQPREHTEFWHRWSTWVMRHPILVLIPTLGLLLVFGVPFRRLQTGNIDMSALPTQSEARRGYDILKRDFQYHAQPRIVVVAQFHQDPALTAENIGALYDMSRQIRALPHVAAIESIVDGGPEITRETYQSMANVPRSFLPPEAQFAIQQTVGSHSVLLSVITNFPAISSESRNLVRQIRNQIKLRGGEILVTGQTALDIDGMEFIMKRTPAAIGFILVMMYIILFLLLGSVLLPLKAVLMNLLSITGSFGALVWIFQDGHLSGWLHFQPGPIEPSLPIILFCAVFGLSMDYEVLLLSRMHEEYIRTGDNTHAVAEGLERSGRLITSAAAIMISVFLAFALAQVVVIKAVGLGMAIAVALDATIVRTLIVPATMRLFGDLNWWAPKPLAKLYNRFGFREMH